MGSNNDITSCSSRTATPCNDPMILDLYIYFIHNTHNITYYNIYIYISRYTMQARDMNIERLLFTTAVDCGEDVYIE